MDFNDKYSWLKVFCFMGYVVEIGLLVWVIMNVNLVNVSYQIQDLFFGDIMDKMGLFVYIWVLVCMYEVLCLYIMINDWLSQVCFDDEFYIKLMECDGIGWGVIEVVRGVFVYWIKVKDGVIENY